MANLNDFKLVKKISQKYADLLSCRFDFSRDFKDDVEKERTGFYPFILESICGVSELQDINEMVTDRQFNLLVNNESFEDHGMDAINISQESNTIRLFNFKYRERFNPEKNKASSNEAILSTKLLNAIETEDLSDFTGKIKVKLEEVIEKLKGNDEWSLVLYMVSNEDLNEEHSDSTIDRLEKVYGLEVEWFGLTQILETIPMRPHPVSAELILDVDAVMSFAENPISSSISYVIRLSIDQVIRITCDNGKIRANYNLEQIEELESVKFEHSLLFDNVRGFITRSKYNQNILDSLKKEPAKFFYYNNGLTVTAKNIETEPINAGKKVRISLKGFQVINGGQTLRTIHRFHQDDKQNIIDYLSNAQILVRIFKTASNVDLNNRIAEYTNSQNSISEVDLKSNRKEQIQLEKYLLENKVIYKRKSGDSKIIMRDEIDTRCYRQVSMERLGQILYSTNGFPHRASSRKKEIFSKHYDSVFGENQLDVAQAFSKLELYFKARSEYENTLEKTAEKSEVTEQKIFYILYMVNRFKLDIKKAIELLESNLTQAKKENKNSRPLISVKFKERLDSELCAVEGEGTQ